MNLTGNTILVTGGGSGIGRGLAEALHRAGNRLVIAGRRLDALRAVAEANPGIEYLRLDLAAPDSIGRLAAELQRRHPDLNVVVNNAGVMPIEDLLTGDPALPEIAGMTVAVKSTSPPPWRSCQKCSRRPTRRPRRGCTPTPSRCAANCAELRSR